jgi:hypothetical protein
MNNATQENTELQKYKYSYKALHQYLISVANCLPSHNYTTKLIHVTASAQI